MAQPEIAIFLGAGASCSEGAPAQGQLFRDFFAESFNGYRGIDHIVAIKNSLGTFFNKFFDIDPLVPSKTAQFPTFEEALAIVDLALTRDDGFRGFGGNLFPLQNGASLRKVRNEFVFLIALILDRKLERSGHHHGSLVRKLDQGRVLSKCTFVNLNYDILIDNALGGQFENNFLDYGIRYADFHGQQQSAGYPLSAASLFKLHGSLNWLYCSACRSITVTPREKGVCKLVVNPNECRCRECNSLTVPIIVPPTYFKVMSNIFLQEVWHGAESALSTCNTWIFCGYSFPDADVHVKYMLKRVQVNWPMQRKILVLNGDKGKESQQASDEEKRYRRFFGGNVQLEYKNISFEQFASDPVRILHDPQLAIH